MSDLAALRHPIPASDNNKRAPFLDPECYVVVPANGPDNATRPLTCG